MAHVLASAVAQALAAGACGALVACGGAVSALDSDAPDADTADGRSNGDARVPEDARHDVTEDFTPPPDVYVQPDVSVGWETGLPDRLEDVLQPFDSGCVPIGQQQFCAPVAYTCVPPGLLPGYNQGSACDPACGTNNFGCQVVVDDAGGSVSIECMCGGGRFPEGLEVLAPAEGGAHGDDPVGRVLARDAALERAAVVAFEQLARELEHHGAPAQLAARARRAAKQEVTHAGLLAREARARGCRVPRTRSRAAPQSARSLRRIARENAVEGCAREAIGAALLALRARLCPDPRLGAVFARIAADETEHAELSWAVHAWLVSRLDDDARARVLDAHERFLDRCEGELPPEACDPRVAAALGMPSPAQWRALVRAVRWGLRGVDAATRAA